MSDHGPTLTPEGYPTEETLQIPETVVVAHARYELLRLLAARRDLPPSLRGGILLEWLFAGSVAGRNNLILAARELSAIGQVAVSGYGRLPPAQWTIEITDAGYEWIRGHDEFRVEET